MIPHHITKVPRYQVGTFGTCVPVPRYPVSHNIIMMCSPALSPRSDPSHYGNTHLHITLGMYKL